MGLSAALRYLGLPELGGGSGDNLAERRFASPREIVEAFASKERNVPNGDPQPGKPVQLLSLAHSGPRDSMTTSHAEALLPAANTDRFSIRVSHGVYYTRPEIVRRPGFAETVLNFHQDQADGKWQLQEIDYRKMADQTPQSFTRAEMGERAFGRVASAVRGLLVEANKDFGAMPNERGISPAARHGDRIHNIMGPLFIQGLQKKRGPANDARPGTGPAA